MGVRCVFQFFRLIWFLFVFETVFLFHSYRDRPIYIIYTQTNESTHRYTSMYVLIWSRSHAKCNCCAMKCDWQSTKQWLISRGEKAQMHKFKFAWKIQLNSSWQVYFAIPKKNHKSFCETSLRFLKSNLDTSSFERKISIQPRELQCMWYTFWTLFNSVLKFTASELTITIKS